MAGAYRFVIQVADTLVMDVDAALYPRKPIDRIGIAPGTSMYLYGQNDRRAAFDWRPQIHDSDGLQIWTGTGEWLWRPLMNPPVVRTNSFVDNSPRGFGLMQRERAFGQYEGRRRLLQQATLGMGGAQGPLGRRAGDAGGDPDRR